MQDLLKDNIRVVLTEEQIQKRVAELGKQISNDYKDSIPVVICMLKGAVVFFADIVRNLKSPLYMDFARLSSYHGGIKRGEMELVNNVTCDIKGKDVLVVEDIVDSGKTLSYFCKLLKEREPKSVKICAFLDKKESRQVPLDVDYFAFDVPCGFVIGYGLDYAEQYRELPYLAEIIDPSKL